jgi:hypothetical protein
VFVILLAKAMGKLKLDQAEWEFLVSPDLPVNKIETKSELTWMLDSNWRLLQQLIELPNYQVKRSIKLMITTHSALKYICPGLFITHERQ